VAKKKRVMVQAVRQAMKSVAEKKWFDVSVTGQTPNAGGLFPIPCLNQIDDGTLDTERVGAKITLTAVQYHLQGHLLPGDTGGNAVRVILYADKQANGLTTTVTSILQDADFRGFRNLDNLERYDILDDRVISFDSPAGVSAVLVPQRAHASVYKKVNYTCSYAGAAATIPLTTCIGVLVIAVNGNGEYAIRTRVRFIDM